MNNDCLDCNQKLFKVPNISNKIYSTYECVENCIVGGLIESKFDKNLCVECK